MLDVALKHKKAFGELEFYNTKFANELGKGIGLPSYEDWEYVESILPYLSICKKLLCASPVPLMLLVICTC